MDHTHSSHRGWQHRPFPRHCYQVQPFSAGTSWAELQSLQPPTRVPHSKPSSSTVVTRI